MAKRKTRGQYHGFLVIDKPAGMTSHDVVSRIRRLVGEKRVGHAGTLDPAATGVLPVAVGLATRTVEYLSDADKAYIGEVTFGVTTDSADGDGEVIDVQDAAHIAESDVRDALRAFAGEIAQVPPMHSAIKVGGQRLYEIARAGGVAAAQVEIPERRITIHEIALLDWEPPVATIFVSCSKGTYIRSIARDLGQRLGTGAFLSNLVRVRTGPFDLDQAWTLDDLETSFASLPWTELAAHPDAALADRPAIVLGAGEMERWRFGNPAQGEGISGTVRVYGETGEWLGVGEGDGTMVTPLKVVVESEPGE